MPELQKTGIRCQVLCECKKFQGLGLHIHTYFPTGKNMTKDEIIEMAKQAHRKLVTEVYVGHMKQLDPWTVELLKIFAKLVAQHEREACAKLCEDDAWRCKKIAVDTQNKQANASAIEASICASAIRARGKHER